MSIKFWKLCELIFFISICKFCILKINIWILKMIFGSENWYFYSKIDISIMKIVDWSQKLFIESENWYFNSGNIII
jgi:hypothetical protein